MKVFIFGNQGNMGKRYTAILKYLGHEVEGMDIDQPFSAKYRDCDAIIIATPSHTHLTLLTYLVDFKRPVLCEKPFVTGSQFMPYLAHWLKDAEKSEMRVSMVSQYDYFVEGSYENEGETIYDYFRTGNDGLAWDCINIIWHAQGKIKLLNQSPIWTCQINGAQLDIKQMDFAYVLMIKDWLEKPYEPQYDRILKSHQKVVDYLNGKFA
jgi:hypothetical protein